MVIWLLGISGAGKTTLGRKLETHLKSENRSVYRIDGDIVRGFFENDLGYAYKDRVANIKRILLAAHVLSESGVTAIICNISPFEHLREFARTKINNYHEIYLNKNLSVSEENDVKNVYAENKGKTDVVGIDIQFETPRASNLVLNVDEQTEEESFQELLNYLKVAKADI